MTYKKNLTLRYAIALGLIACVLLMTFLVLAHQIERNKQDAHIINISGKQRMLSQRISLLSREIYHAETNQAANLYADKMRKSLAIMIADHQELITGRSDGDQNVRHRDLSYDLKEIYHGDNGINRRVESFFKLAQDFLTLYDLGGQDAIRESALMDQIVAIGRNGLLDQLNLAVDQYQYEAEAKVEQFKLYEILFLCLGLFILILEVIFIFRPMVRVMANKAESLEIINKELLEFSYRISHDLRAPIVSSLGLVDAAQKSLEKHNTTISAQALKLIHDSMQRLENLVEDIMSLTRMKMVENPKAHIKGKDLIDESIEKLKNMPRADEIDIEKDIALSPPLYIEKIYLQQSIDNILSNAIKYADFAKTHSYIKITTKNDRHNYYISIRDNGLGIPKNSRKKIFAMFQRFHPRVSFGSGLGLYLVRQNIENLGGEVTYIPHPDGSEFTIEIPLLKINKGENA